MTDAGLDHLKGLSRLQFLNLGATKVSDAGLEKLEALTDLRYLHLSSYCGDGRGACASQRVDRP